jgi:excisionase family DNA binding protein
MDTKSRSNDIGGPLLTDEEACNHLRISQRQLYTWRMQGAIPFIRIGRSVRYRMRDLDAAIDALTVVSHPRQNAGATEAATGLATSGADACPATLHPTQSR